MFGFGNHDRELKKQKRVVLAGIDLMSKELRNHGLAKGKTQVLICLEQIQKAMHDISNMTKAAEEADFARECEAHLDTLRKAVANGSISSTNDLETQLYHTFKTSVLYQEKTDVNEKLQFGLTHDEVRTA